MIRHSMLLLALILYTADAQQFSDIQGPQTEMLDMGSNEPHGVYIDEAALLAWVNLRYMPTVHSQKEAQAYCEDLNLEGYSWQVPTASQLLSLSSPRYRPSMHPAIVYGRSYRYIASDTPPWDNTMQYGFDFRHRSILVFPKESKKLHLRCVATLE